jgi:hypothetical protein
MKADQSRAMEETSRDKRKVRGTIGEEESNQESREKAP